MTSERGPERRRGEPRRRPGGYRAEIARAVRRFNRALSDLKEVRTPEAEQARRTLRWVVGQLSAVDDDIPRLVANVRHQLGDEPEMTPPATSAQTAARQYRLGVVRLNEGLREVGDQRLRLKLNRLKQAVMALPDGNPWEGRPAPPPRVPSRSAPTRLPGRRR